MACLDKLKALLATRSMRVCVNHTCAIVASCFDILEQCKEQLAFVEGENLVLERGKRREELREVTAVIRKLDFGRLYQV